MVFKRFIIIILIFSSIKSFAQEDNNLFLYIPDNEAMSNYLYLHNYLKAWDNNEAIVNEDLLTSFFNNYVGTNSLYSLLFESFLRYTKNTNIQERIVNYIEQNGIETDFTTSLIRLYSSVPIIRQSDGKDVIQYSYNNSLFDENINLFLFNEVGLFNGELGMLLFENNWNNLSLTGSDNSNFESFFLIYGGGTNAITISFRKYSNLEEDFDAIFRLDYYNNMYNGKWITIELPLEGILSRAGADRIIIAYGLGPDRNVNQIETGTFNVYLYDKQNKNMYEISFFMNFSPINIHFSQRTRIFNFLFFQTLFVFIR